MPVLVGTSGFQYADWRGPFYPAGVPQRRWLEHYAERFATVELNVAFYRLPALAVFQGWRERTPADFVATVKASHYLTHIKRLRDPAEPVARLMERAAGLGPKLGPILVQLPPTLQADAQLLDDCLACFPSSVRVVVEPRHASWWTDEIRAVLTARQAALCWADRDSQPVTPLWRTTDWGYLRLHAGGGPTVWPYEEGVLATWAGRLAETWTDEENVFVYTNNDPGCAAPRDAATIARLLERHGRRTTRTPDSIAVAT